VRFRLAQDHARLGDYRRRAGDRAEADRHYRQGSELLDRLAGEHPEIPEYPLVLAWCCHRLGNLHETTDRSVARAHYRRALDTLPKLVADHPGLAATRQLLAEVHIGLGSLETAEGSPEKAADHFRAARDLLAALAEDLPDGGRGPGGPGQNQNSLAWFLVICPDPQFRDPHRAIELARRALDRAPKHADFWNTLGVAYYRAGQPAEAVAALEQAIKLRVGGGDATDYFFLAMARWQSGDEEQSQQAYGEALRWLERFPGAAGAELVRIRLEADEVLGRFTQPGAHGLFESLREVPHHAGRVGSIALGWTAGGGGGAGVAESDAGASSGRSHPRRVG
jgi:tetratricopeptide (TPR) repeat protein